MSLLSLPDLSPLSSFASQTKGACSLFALSTEIHHPPSDGTPAAAVPEIHTTLALACRRRLIVLNWVDGTWNPQIETALPHQIRGMAFEGRKIVAGFSTGECGVVTLPPFEGARADDPPVLGDLFSLPLPIADKAGGAASHRADRGAVAVGSAAGGGGGGGGALSSLGLSGVGAGLGALSGLALGKKLEKNGVVGIPKLKARMPGAKGKAAEASQSSDDWLSGTEWGWDGDSSERRDEVLVVRDST